MITYAVVFSGQIQAPAAAKVSTDTIETICQAICLHQARGSCEHAGKAASGSELFGENEQVQLQYLRNNLLDPICIEDIKE